MPTIEIYDKDQKAIGSFSLTEDVITIGRAGDNHIVLPNNPRVSRYHAVLIKCVDEKKRFFIRDLSSSHGVYLGKKRIFHKIMNPDDKIHIDDFVLVYTENEGSEDISIHFTDESPEEMFMPVDNYSLEVERQKTVCSKLEFGVSGLSGDDKLWLEELNYKAKSTFDVRSLSSDILDFIFHAMGMKKGSIGCVFQFDEWMMNIRCLAQKKIGLQSSIHVPRQVLENLKKGKSFMKGHMLCNPVINNKGVVLGFLCLFRGTYEQSFQEDDFEIVSIACQIIASVLIKKGSDVSSERENPKWPRVMIGNAPVFEKIKEIATFDTNVLLLGETGVGKEVAALEIHRASKRKGNPLIFANCASIPNDFLESELFGYEKGAFTGAIAKKLGQFETADGGTIFLDEIGEMPLEMQAKILRVLQEKEVKRLGEERSRKVDVRIIAATNRDIKKEMEEGTFRNDLFYRFENIIEIQPLRFRKHDIPILVHYFIDTLEDYVDMPLKSITPQAMRQLLSYPWFGNVRELKKCIKDSLMKSNGLINIHHLSQEIQEWKTHLIDQECMPSVENEDILSIEEVEKAHIMKVLQRMRGNKEETARVLGVSKQTIFNKIKKYKLDEYVKKIRTNHN